MMAVIIYQFVILPQKAKPAVGLNPSSFLIGFGVVFPIILYEPLWMIDHLHLESLNHKMMIITLPSSLSLRCLEGECKYFLLNKIMTLLTIKFNFWAYFCITGNRLRIYENCSNVWMYTWRTEEEYIKLHNICFLSHWFMFWFYHTGTDPYNAVVILFHTKELFALWLSLQRALITLSAVKICSIWD